MIGLSLILLMIVFRSIAVPIKATLGYLLSVGAALGAVVVVFQWGWADAMRAGLADGPDRQLPADLPDGRAVRAGHGLRDVPGLGDARALRPHRRPREAVIDGFTACARVVTAAALIMISVFVAFVPDGATTIKPIALGLAVGVFVDAFLVRMTLVPAVLALLDHRAWWLPGPSSGCRSSTSRARPCTARSPSTTSGRPRDHAAGRDLVVRGGAPRSR